MCANCVPGETAARAAALLTLAMLLSGTSSPPVALSLMHRELHHRPAGSAFTPSWAEYRIRVLRSALSLHARLTPTGLSVQSLLPTFSSDNRWMPGCTKPECFGTPEPSPGDMLDMVQELPDPHRAAILLHAYGSPAAELSDTLDESADRVRLILHEARMALTTLRLRRLDRKTNATTLKADAPQNLHPHCG